ncbi:Zn-ribbon domain-containing OB-fold protein [Ottowia thiooxydans]|uniref:Zn-ribbon domain-containing OB-fold protein n=1 Tax=Ottowia thiooxydans TaxID=219182 RepID=UPI00048F108D|nr:OB-fold domain-containing protein [Ottowia thiooxydans]
MSEPTKYLAPSPIPTPETESFWTTAREGVFLVPRCRTCERAHWYPRAICPHCMGSDVTLEPSTGLAKVYSYTVTRHASHPFVLAYVTLSEGPSMLTHLVGKDPDAWSIGDEVQVQFQATDGDYPIPVFAPYVASTLKERSA